MYQKYCEEKSINSLLNERSMSFSYCNKPSKCTCVCEKSLHATTLAGWDNSCCNQQLDICQSKENNLHTRSAPLLSCDKPLLTCAFIHSSNHELHIQQYRESHKYYGNRQNYATVAVAQLPLSTWNCSIPTTVKPRLLMMAGNMKINNAARNFPNKEKPNRSSSMLPQHRFTVSILSLHNIIIPIASFVIQEPMMSVDYPRPSMLKPPKPEYKTKIHLSRRSSLRHKKHKEHKESVSPSQKNELAITAKPCYIDHNHRPYSEDARPCTNFNKRKLAKSRLAALLELRKYTNTLQHPQWDNSDNNSSQITYQTHYIHERSQPTTSSSAITIMEPWIMFN